jgi:hypothetical protein
LTWWLVWQLTDGCLTTHLREIDGIDQAKIVVASLSIVEDGSIPFLLLDPPLRSAASARPDFVERAMFNSLGSETVVFLRPGFLAPGKIMAFPSDDWIQLRAGTGYGMEVQVISSRGRSAAEAVLFGILESLNEA